MKAILALLFVFGVTASDDPCAIHPNCQECVSDHPHFCGWCSTPVVYKNGGPQGNHCGTLDGTHPYACYGVFSTEDCIRGYKCNVQNGICELTDAGSGLPYDACAKNCSAVIPSASPSPSPPPLYKCDQTNPKNWTCVPARPGEGASLEVCKQNCDPTKPTPSPASSSTAQIFKCNTTTKECYPVPPGTAGGASNLLCSQECKASTSPQPNEKFVCNTTNFECVKTSSNGTVFQQCEQLCQKRYYCDQTDALNPTCKLVGASQPGLPLPDCLDSCKAHNSTPSDLKGVWRGLQIGKDYKAGEWDFNFLETSVIASFAGTSMRGDVSFTGRSPNVVLTIHVVESSLSGIHPGDSLVMIYSFDGAAPEVRYLSLASSQPNGQPPKDFADAKSGSFFDWTLWECQPLTGCHFNQNKFVRAPVKIAVQSHVEANPDPCSTEGTCTECLAHKFCGWCSVPVVYKDGTQGAQCAGYGNATRNQFECHGVFRTDDCNDYLCIEPQGICTKVPLGGGEDHDTCMKDCKVLIPSQNLVSPTGPPASMPSPSVAPVYACELSNYTCFQTAPGTGSSLEVCIQSCHKATTPTQITPVPISPASPKPTAKVYKCDFTNYSCIVAQPGEAGAGSREICLNNCKRPSPRPVPIVGNKLRGLQVDNKYVQGEYDVSVDLYGGYKLSLNGTEITSGTLSLGTKIGTVVVSTKSGKYYTGYYTQSVGRDVTHTLIAFGSSSSDVPSGWDAPWIHGGSEGSVWVWIEDHA
jgi:hypothetical protein